MIHMWAPIRVWFPLLTFGFVLYFIAEVVAWLANAYSKLEPLAAARGARSTFRRFARTEIGIRRRVHDHHGCIYRLYVRSYAAYGADYTPPRASSRE